MAKAVVRPAEITFATSLLRAIGGNVNNLYLVLAIVAWVRQESGSKYIGNNPLNIRNSPLAVGYRKSRGNGHFAIFASLAAAAQASAAFLKNNHGVGYEAILAAARRGASGTSAQVNQAKDVLTAIALSKWDAAHYGAADGDLAKNHIVRVWVGLTGHPIPLEYLNPKAPPAKQAKPKPPPKPPFQQQQSMKGSPNLFIRHEYLDPHHAGAFYHDRKHHGDYVLPHDAPLTE